MKKVLILAVAPIALSAAVWCNDYTLNTPQREQLFTVFHEHQLQHMNHYSEFPYKSMPVNGASFKD